MPNMEATIVRGYLQGVSLGYRAPEFINREIFPWLDMPSSRAKILTYNRGDQSRLEAKARARGTEAATRTMKIDSIDVNTKQVAIKERITDEDIRDAGLPDNASPSMSLQQDAIEMNARSLDMYREVAVRDAIFAATWADGNLGGEDAAGLWAPTDATNTFLTDIETALGNLTASGVGTTNLRLMLDYATFMKLNRVAEIRDRFKYTSDKSLSEQSLATMLGIDRVLIAKSIRSTAREKKDGTDFTASNIWEKNAGKGSAFLYVYPSAPGLKTMAAGYQPRNKMPNGEYRLTKSYRREELSAWEYESQEDTGVVVTSPLAGYLWNDTIVT